MGRGEAEEERRMLEEAGWEFVESSTEKIVWRRPGLGYLYPQEAAVDLLRRERSAGAGRESKREDGGEGREDGP